MLTPIKHCFQLSLAIPPWAGATSTSQRAVMLCARGVKAGMVCEWVAGKTVIPLLSWAIPERFRDEVHDKALYKSTLLYLQYNRIQ